MEKEGGEAIYPGGGWRNGLLWRELHMGDDRRSNEALRFMNRVSKLEHPPRVLQPVNYGAPALASVFRRRALPKRIHLKTRIGEGAGDNCGSFPFHSPDQIEVFPRHFSEVRTCFGWIAGIPQGNQSAWQSSGRDSLLPGRDFQARQQSSCTLHF